MFSAYKFDTVLFVQCVVFSLFWRALIFFKGNIPYCTKSLFLGSHYFRYCTLHFYIELNVYNIRLLYRYIIETDSEKTKVGFKDHKTTGSL